METLGGWIFMRVITQVDLLLACGLYSFALTRRRHFVFRLIFCSVVSLLLAVLYGWGGYAFLSVLLQSNQDAVSITYPVLNTITHLLLYCNAILSLRVCFSDSHSTLLFAATAGYATKDLANLTNNILETVYSPLRFNLQNLTFLSVSIHLLIYLIVYGGLFLLSYRTSKDIRRMSSFFSKRVLVAFLFLILLPLITRSLTVYFRSESSVLYIALCISEMCCCLLILISQMFMVRFMVEKQENEMEVQISKMKAKQYELSRESINQINIKFHDIKHQIARYRQEGKVDPSYLGSIEKSLSFYDAIVSTGNDAFDTLITEKKLNCLKEEIQFSVLADENSLSFLGNQDIYSLFGNALDNAIEYLSTLPKEKRILKLAVTSDSSFVHIDVKNYFEGVLTFGRDGLPFSTKGDMVYHGYGLRSIQEIVHRYKGNMVVFTQPHQFCLDILIPVKK